MDELASLVKHNPNLQTINLEFSEIESLDPLLPYLVQFPRLKELLLFGNRIEKIPKDLSKLKVLEKLDISNNLIESIDTVIPGLLSLPSLKELHITLQNTDEELKILEKLPGLLNLNGNSIEKLAKSASNPRSGYEETEGVRSLLPCQSSGFFTEETSLNQEFLEQIANIYDEIRSLWLKEDKSKDGRLAADFDESLKSIMGELSEVLKEGHQEFVINIFSLKAKFELGLICQRKLTSLVSKKNDKVGKKLKETNGILENVFKESITNMLGIQPKLDKKIKNMKAEVVQFQTESAEVIEAADQLQQEAKLLKDTKERLIKQFQDEREELMAEIQSLQEENKKYLDTIIRHSKNFAESALSGRSIEDEEREKKFMSTGSSSGSKSAGKVLSLRQLKETIEEIYASKVKYDERCFEGKMPRETMEQHMYNYLNKKYGLKNLVLDWASAIVNSIKKYSNEDNDVAVFGLILRNECDEEFRLVQIQVKKTVGELLKVNLRNRFPFKSNADVNDMVNEKISGFLNEEEWTEIVRFMYNENDSEYILSQLYSMKSRDESISERPSSKAKITREEAIILKEREKLLRGRILYSEFLNLLLDFQLNGHEKFLARFVKIFRKVDMNADGVLTELEFKRLLSVFNLGFSEDDCIRLLQIVDPFDNQQITFSECVSLFTAEIIPSEGISIMQKLAFEEQ